MPRREAANSLIAKQQNMFALRKLRAQNNPLELQILAAGLPKPETEYQFAKVALGRNWKADLAWPTWKILFEQEGAAFGNVVHVGIGAYTMRNGQRVELPPGSTVRLGGRHNTGPGMSGDIEKYNQAQLLGWIVIRATTTQIRDGIAITWIERAFAIRGYKK